METKLATIICSDVIGYSSLMQADEIGTLHKLDACRAIIDPLITQFKGRLFNTGGDSVLIEFPSAVDAVKFGVEMQAQIGKLNNGMRWRIGIHMGEVWIYGTNLMGDAVNLAARTESLADYGGVTMTDTVYKMVVGKMKNLEFISRGVQEFKNVNSMEIWSVVISNATPNPYLNKAPKKEISETVKSHQDLLKTVINDQAAKNKTLHDAQTLKRDGKLGPATRVLMWRVTKQDKAAVDELISLGIKNLIPNELKVYASAVIREFCTKLDSDRLLTIADLMENWNYNSAALDFVKIAAKVNDKARQRYALMIFNDPTSSDTEINAILDDLKELAMKKNVDAMIKLGEYYTKINDKKNAFRWLYTARAQHNTHAQKLIEELNKTISRTDFQNFKTDADALVDQIKFIDDNRMK
ncbi:adenylate/guanylate cyclase domain-containing protein [bacterium]|nr:adenylate/guanylate cyclase domain-containing protein [bacterium]